MKYFLSNKNFSSFKPIMFVLLLAALLPLNAIIDPQLLGEDEALTYLVSTNILNHISNLNLNGFLSEIIKDWHPPGRNLFPLLSIKILGFNLTSIRIPYYILWIVTCVLGVLITKRFSSNTYAYICGCLLAGSGLFHLQVLALSHGFVSFIIMLSVYLITKNKQFLSEDFSPNKFIILSIILFVGFLFFNTVILITMMVYFIQLFLILKSDQIRINITKFFIISFFVTCFYLIYFCIFLGFPMLMVNSLDFLIFLKDNFGIHDFGNWKGENFGQYHQYLVRSSTAKVNITSLISNIQYLNWHFFPFLSVLVIPCSIFALYKDFKKILILIFPYLIITNFYMIGNTGQHFASLFICLIPFFCIYMSKITINNSYKKIINIIIFLTVIPYTLWAHVTPYNVINYPYKVISSVFGAEKWPPNLHRPLERISKTIKKRLTSNDHIAYSIDGAISLYYLNNFQMSQLNNNQINISLNKDLCNTFTKKYKALITNNHDLKNCTKYIKEKINFKNSKIIVYFFK